MGSIIKDPFGRILDYVRISVTDRCNFRCTYCMPEDGVEWIPHEKVMSYEDIHFLIGLLRELGVRRIRFTGGEPFVRKGFPAFLESVRVAHPDLMVAVTTNGSLVEPWAKKIAALGLDSINISLDTLNPEKFRGTTRRGNLAKVLAGLDALRDKGVHPIKLNTVVMDGFNFDEISSLTAFARSKGAIQRFIEFMPLDGDVWSKAKFVPAEKILSALPDSENWKELHGPSGGGKAAGPARYYQHGATGQKVGIISAVSDHFCDFCNRLRVTSLGVIRPCLFGNFGVPLLDHLRAKNGAAAKDAIMAAVARKPGRGETDIPEGEVFKEVRHMSQIGG